MVLVDTSVWIEHLWFGHAGLEPLLTAGKVICHPFVIGELACGTLKNRKTILSLLKALPSAVEADHAEVLDFLGKNLLMGRGLGLIDVHLIASAFLSGIPLWTLDKKLVALSIGDLRKCAPFRLGIILMHQTRCSSKQGEPW